MSAPDRLYALLTRHPEGLTYAQIAQHLGYRPGSDRPAHLAVELRAAGRARFEGSQGGRGGRLIALSEPE